MIKKLLNLNSQNKWKDTKIEFIKNQNIGIDSDSNPDNPHIDIKTLNGYFLKNINDQNNKNRQIMSIKNFHKNH